MKTSTKPQVSIITPAFNSAHCIENALKYALAQTYAHWDMIVVNDGSTDNTAEIVQSYADKHPNIKLHTLPRNRGVFYARNFGVTLASEFVVFLDADDELTPTAIEEAVKAQQEHDVDIVQSSYAVFVDKMNARVMVKYMNEQMGSAPLSGSKVIQAYSQVQGISFTMWAKLYKRSILEFAIKKLNIISANKLNYAEDLLLFAAMFTKDVKAIATNNIAYVFHMNDQSLSGGAKTEEQVFEKQYGFNYTKHLAKPYISQIFQTTGIKFDTYSASENWFKMLDVPKFQNIRKQIQVLQVWMGVGMHNHGSEHIQKLKQLWDENVFSKCILINGLWTSNDGSEKIDPNEVLYSNCVEIWNGKTSEEIYNENLDLKQTFELINLIWSSKENGVDVTKQTNELHGGWYNNYIKITSEL
ncbi:Glycosyl_transferase family 2 protein [Hexamita inflata]|uniref:Glycosyl_transferase family 2 protein n=1 Tax=Hexamita inflata TaxID=28002 RepID=A0ABP1HDW1_9EUKA